MQVQSIGTVAQIATPPAEPSALAAKQASAAAAAAAAKSTARPEPVVAVEKPEADPTPSELNDAVQNINKTMQSLGQDLEFSVDAESNRTIVKVIDQRTQEVIRQMPSAEALEIAKALDRVQGLLIRQQA
jgi:flagellar protein FlaG